MGVLEDLLMLAIFGVNPIYFYSYSIPAIKAD